jgi:hypothetical protein
MGRIKGNDSIKDVVVKMSEGNPGALDVIMQMLERGAVIDPDDFMGGLGGVLFLDTLGIYGWKIYVLYNDLCERDLPRMLAVLRSVQLGFFDGETLKRAVSVQDRSGKSFVPVEDLCQQVKQRLPNFKFNNFAEAGGKS